MVSKYERLARIDLKSDGWLIDYKLRGRFPVKGYTVDFFSAFDIMAYKPNQLKFVSVKGRAGVPKGHRDLLTSFKLPAGVTKEIWTYSDKNKVKKEIVGS